MQPAVAVGQLPFVDQKTGVGLSGRYEVLDLIERHDDMPDGWLIQSQREKRGREFAGHGYEPSRERTSRTLPRRRFARDEARPVAIANARAMREQGIPVGEIRICMQGDRGDFQLPGQRAPVQRLDVGQLVHVATAAGVDFSGRHRPEHECVVGVGAVRDADNAGIGDTGNGTRGHVPERAPVTREASALKLVSASEWSAYSGRFRVISAGSLRRKSAYARASCLASPRSLYACARST